MRTPAIDRKQTALAALPAFAGASRRDLAELAGTLDLVAVPAGTTTLVQGAIGHDFHLLVDGVLRVERDGEVVATLTAGSVVGEAALLERVPRNATVVAETDAVLAVGMRMHLAGLVARFPGLQQQLRRSHQERTAGRRAA